MAQRRLALAEIKGLTPAVDPTVSQEVFALSGRNYAFDSLGPKSCFGNRLLLPQERSKPAHAQGIRVKLRNDDRCFTIDGDGIWEWKESIGGFVSVFTTPDTTLSPHRWTHGYLNGYLYLAHPRVGLLAYNLETEICLPHKAIGVGTPEDVIAITENNGRLIVVGPQLFSWSAPSDGLNFEPTLGGAGFQVIGDRVPGNPIMVSNYTRGCLTWTAGGVLRSEFTGDAAVYRHRSLNTEYRPVNSFCSARVDDDSVVILDERGLFKTRGETPEPFTPVFNEFLMDYIQRNNLKVGNNLRLEWDELRRFMYISASLSYASPIYEQAFVLYPPLDKWGTFDEEHYGILPIQIDSSQRADDYYGFVDSQGRVRYWLDAGSRENRPEDSPTKFGANLYQPATTRTIKYADADIGTYMPAWCKANTISKIGMSQPAAYYVTGSGSPITPEVNGLDAKLQFGLIRASADMSADEMSEVINVMIRSAQTGPEAQVGEDYLIVPDSTSDQDYNIVAGSEDFGFETLNYVNHQTRIIGTIDGVTQFDSAVPDLVAFIQGARHYACSVEGIWHIGEVAAVNIGESFHIRTFELTFAPAGRLL